MITEIAEQPVPDLDTFERVWASLPHGERVGFRYFMPDSPGTTRVHVVRVERQWFAPRRCAERRRAVLVLQGHRQSADGHGSHQRGRQQNMTAGAHIASRYKKPWLKWNSRLPTAPTVCSRGKFGDRICH